jgi:hypothetical protein
MLRCVLFIITVLVLGLLAGKPRFKGWLEGVRTGACHRSIIWVQVGPQARIRDLILAWAWNWNMTGQWPRLFEVWNVPREFNILPSLFASRVPTLRMLRMLRACVRAAAAARLASCVCCSASLAWPGSPDPVSHSLAAFGTDFPPYRHDDWSLVQHKNEHGSSTVWSMYGTDRTNHDGWGCQAGAKVLIWPPLALTHPCCSNSKGRRKALGWLDRFSTLPFLLRIVLHTHSVCVTAKRRNSPRITPSGLSPT